MRVAPHLASGDAVVVMTALIAPVIPPKIRYVRRGSRAGTAGHPLRMSVPRLRRSARVPRPMASLPWTTGAASLP